MVFFAETKQYQCKLIHWFLFKTVFDGLNDVETLVFTLATFMKSSLKLAEYVGGLGDVVETVSEKSF